MRRTGPLLLLALTGCGTITDLADGRAQIFGGVRTDWDYGVKGNLCCRVGALAPCFVLDLPLSAAADVALLPVTIPANVFAPKPIKMEQ